MSQTSRGPRAGIVGMGFIGQVHAQAVARCGGAHEADTNSTAPHVFSGAEGAFKAD
ncbi:hypothetical protein [Arthrobacter sp. SLBN-100]|uniref:hypothetical protein n=1 Tax=Arthrobacter sp. SLBN-100 TaxID=2768450 RepID=UPI0013572FE9|nr:hypothetical protein [Arthrobacter sp. SLBN-100]